MRLLRGQLQLNGIARASSNTHGMPNSDYIRE